MSEWIASGRAVAYGLTARPFFNFRDWLAVREFPELAFALRATHRQPLSLRLGPSSELLRAASALALDAAALATCETPFFTARSLLASLGLGAGDALVDLGCGNGNVLLAARACGAVARGVEIDSARAAWIAAPLRAVGVHVVAGDARDADVRGMTHIFLAWTTWPAEIRAAVAARLQLDAGDAMVLSMTWPVGEGFELISTRRLWTSWGRAEVLVQRRERGR